MGRGQKRSYQRFYVGTSAILIFKDNLKETFLLKDFSPRGGGIFGHHPLQINEKVAIIFKVPLLFDRPIRKEAKIAWCNKLQEDVWEGGLDFGLDNLINF